MHNLTPSPSRLMIRSLFSEASLRYITFFQASSSSSPDESLVLRSTAVTGGHQREMQHPPLLLHCRPEPYEIAVITSAPFTNVSQLKITTDSTENIEF